MLIALIFIIVLFEIVINVRSGSYLITPMNITNLINQNSYVVILACGMLICILSGGNIDLSVGSQVVLIGALAGVFLIDMRMNVWLAIGLCLLAGIGLGAWQGFWIAYMRIPAFIVTLAGMMTFRGMAQLILGGFTKSPFREDFTRYFNSFLPGDRPEMRLPVALTAAGVICAVFIAAQIIGRVRKIRKKYDVEKVAVTAVRTAVVCAVAMGIAYMLGLDRGIPVILILLAAVVAAYSYYTKHTVPGRRLYAMGGNEKAAKLSGINTNRILFFAYTNMGFLSALAALVCVARFRAATPSAGMGFELDAIGACFIGGASAYGGIGTIYGAVIGAVFMGVLNIGMSIAGMDQYWQSTIKGIVLLTAVVFDIMSRKRKQAA